MLHYTNKLNYIWVFTPLSQLYQCHELKPYAEWEHETLLFAAFFNYGWRLLQREAKITTISTLYITVNVCYSGSGQLWFNYINVIWIQSYISLCLTVMKDLNLQYNYLRHGRSDRNIPGGRVSWTWLSGSLCFSIFSTLLFSTFTSSSLSSSTSSIAFSSCSLPFQDI